MVAIRVDPSLPADADAGRRSFFDRVLRRIRALPGVEGAGLRDALPLGQNIGWRSWDVSTPARGDARPAEALVRRVDEGYFRAMRIPLRAGRSFAAADAPSSEPVVVVNDTLARTLWADSDPIGRVLRTQGVDGRVVGVVPEVRYFALERPSGPEMYLPLRQEGGRQPIDLVVRGSIPDAALAASLRDTLRRIDAALPVTDVRTMAQLVDRSVFARRFVVWLITGLAAFGLLLASLGIYAVISYGVAQRTQEIRIRLALGEPPTQLQRRFLTDTLKLIIIGLAVGLPAAWGTTRTIRGLLCGVLPSDPLTFVGVLLSLHSSLWWPDIFPRDRRRASIRFRR